MLVYRDGSVQVNHGGTEMGQGLFTKIQQIAADSLGVPLDRVRLMPTRTDKVPNTSRRPPRPAPISTAPRSPMPARSCAAGCSRLPPALLGCDPSDVRFRRTAPRAAAAAGRRSPHVCEAAYMQRVPLFAQGYYRTPGHPLRSRRPARGKPFHYFAYGAAVSEVEVDGFTGDLPPAANRHPAGRRRFDFAGRRSRPDRRRLHPGRRLADDRGAAVGRRGAASPPAAPPPTSCRRGPRCPRCSRSTSLERATQPDVVFGSKAVGEPPLMLAISVREALRDAVAAFGDGDRRHLRQPGHTRARLLRRRAARAPSARPLR